MKNFSILQNTALIVIIFTVSACNAPQTATPASEATPPELPSSVLRGSAYEGDTKQVAKQEAPTHNAEAPAPETSEVTPAPKKGFLAGILSLFGTKRQKHEIVLKDEKTGETMSAEFNTNGDEKSVTIAGAQMGFGAWPSDWPQAMAKYQNANVKSFQKTKGMPELNQNPNMTRYMVDFSTTDHKDAVANFYRGLIPNYGIPLNFENKVEGRTEMTFKNQNTKDIFLISIQPINGGGADVSLTLFDEP